MHSRLLTLAAACLALGVATAQGAPPATEPRLKEIWYDPHAVVTVPVKRGVVTLVMLDADEGISEVGTGLGADCNKPEASWCVAAQPGGRNIFVKPKSTARAANNLAVVTTRRTHSFRFVVLEDSDARQPLYRLAVKAVPAAPLRPYSNEMPALDTLAENRQPRIPSPQLTSAELVGSRLKAAPVPRNSTYSMAEGAQSEDILPTLVFDDGRFTYFRFPNNREVPAVFHVLGDGSETLLNARMEGDLLVVDRVSRRLMLRAGHAVVGIWNDAFDHDGVPPAEGTTIDGVRRVIKQVLSGSPNPPNTENQP